MRKILSEIFQICICFPGMEKEIEVSSVLVPALWVSFKAAMPNLKGSPFSGTFADFVLISLVSWL